MRGFLMKRFGTLNLILIWILFSLLAIAYIGTRPYLGLAIAVVGGIVLGVASFLDFEARQRETWEKRQREAEEASAGEGVKADGADQDAEESLEGDSE